MGEETAGWISSSPVSWSVVFKKPSGKAMYGGSTGFWDKNTCFGIALKSYIWEV